MRVDRASGLGAVLALACAGLSCTPGPAPAQPPRPHPYFPIGDGATHALGTTTADGELKCTSCHAITVTNYAQFECTGCHEHAQDRLEPFHLGFDGYVYASSACYACHGDGTAAHAPSAKLDARDPSQDLQLTGLIPTWSGTTIVGVNPEAQTLGMPMNHRSAQVPAALAAECSSCHLDVELGIFFPGQYHASLAALSLAQPTACAECHASAPEGFVGDAPTGYPRLPPTGEMRHDAVTWSAGAPTGTPVVTQDCGVCHVAPSMSAAALWSTDARFHPALAAAGAAQPGSCLDCHANTRPGLLDSTTAALPANVVIDHSGLAWLGDCAACHTAGFGAWSGGKFHLPTSAAPASCLPCHAQERPTSTAAWTNATYTQAPFDYVPNAQGVSHGAGQDCAVCHADPAGWATGHFTHGPTTLSGSTCVACHSTQRPTMPVSGFDHSTSGTGDCFGCHQGTSAFGQLSDWAGGQSYPGANLIASTDQFITVTELTLKHGGANNLVTGAASTQATLFNAMLHTSPALPSDLAAGPSPGDPATCWHCHTHTPGTQNVASFLGGQFHASLTNHQSDPDAGVTALPQPTSGCTDCHSNMRPAGIVQSTNLKPMDHAAAFKATVDVGGAMVSTVSALDCSVCHATPGGSWGDGAFHSKISPAAQAQLADCTVCHYTLMADPQVDVISTASPNYAMKHRSGQLTFQQCDRCHPNALTNATGTPATALWAPGSFHANLSTQPGACVDCHLVTEPANAAQSTVAYHGDPQWMSHAVAAVAGKDCAFCHASDATAGAWNPSTRLHHGGFSPSPCAGCHGAANGAAGNNVPAGLTDSSTVTSASASTGVAGVHDQISHARSQRHRSRLRLLPHAGGRGRRGHRGRPGVGAGGLPPPLHRRHRAGAERHHGPVQPLPPQREAPGELHRPGPLGLHRRRGHRLQGLPRVAGHRLALGAQLALGERPGLPQRGRLHGAAAAGTERVHHRGGTEQPQAPRGRDRSCLHHLPHPGDRGPRCLRLRPRARALHRLLGLPRSGERPGRHRVGAQRSRGGQRRRYLW